MIKLATPLALAAMALTMLAGPVMAASGPAPMMERVVVDPRDTESLQRGARLFVNYCLNCHGAQFMRYNRLADLGLTEAQIAGNLMFGGRFAESDDGATQFAPIKVGDTMRSAMRAEDGKAWFGAQPPDLSVIARVRGSQWLYNYLIGFYRDDQAVTDWNNLVFPNVAMPHALWQLSGVNRLKTAEYPTYEAAQGAAIAIKGLAVVEPTTDHKYVVKSLAQETPGSMSGVEYRAAVQDLVNFLEYIAEPARNARVRTGIAVLLFLLLAFFFVYWLKREYWKDLH